MRESGPSGADVRQVDVVVVGGGPAGEVVAGRCADRGLDTVLVERELVGGECSYWGCIPSKTLVRPGDVLAAARRVPGAAAAVRGPLDVAAALARRNYMTSGWSDDGQERWLADHGVGLIRGSGRLAGPRRVTVDGGPTVSARRAVVLATGSSPVTPPVPGLAEVRAWDNRSATAAKEVPARLLVLGGGAVGLELAQAFRRLGSGEVTVVEGAARLLPREESFAGDQVRAALEQDGIDVRVGTLLTAVERDGTDGPVRAHAEHGRPDRGRRGARRGRAAAANRGSRPRDGWSVTRSGGRRRRPAARGGGAGGLAVRGGGLHRAGPVHAHGEVPGTGGRRRPHRPGHQGPCQPWRRPPGDVHRPAGLRGRVHHGRGGRAWGGRPRDRRRHRRGTGRVRAR